METVNILLRERSALDLIILDICIPQVDGPGIAQILEEYAPNIPVIVSSCIPIQDQKVRIRKAVGYHSKMDKLDLLWDKVQKAMGV